MNELAYIIPGVVAMTLILTVGGVILFRPLSRRLGELLEAMAAERQQGHPRLQEHLTRIGEHLEAQNQRLTLLEERVEFTERLLERKTGDDVTER